MKLVKWLLIGLAVVLALVGAVMAGGIFYIQNRDLSGLVAWAAQRQGYTVRSEGPVRVKLFPSVIVKVEKFSVDALQGSGKLFEVDAAAVRLAWGKGMAPWKGMTLTDVEAKNPTVTLVKDKHGVANWVPAEKSGKSAEPTDGKVAGCEVGEECNMLPMLVATKLAVANLNVVYKDETSGREVVVKDMDLMANTRGTRAVTKLSGSVNGQAVSGNMEVDLGNMENIPVTAKMDGGGLSVAVDGRVVEEKQFAGMVNAQTANLKSTLAALMGKAPVQAPADAFSLTGDVTVGAERVVLRNFNTHLGDLLAATGNIDVALGDKPSGKGQIRVSGSNLRQLAELGSGQAQPSLPALPFTLSTALTGDNAIVLKGLSFSLGNVATVGGDVRVVPPAATGGQPEVDASLAWNVGNVSSLMKSVGQSGTFPDQPLKGNVVLKGKDGTYSVQKLDAQLADLVALSGKADVTPGAKPKVDGSFSVSGDNVQAAARSFGVAAGAIPASAFKAGASISGQGTLSVDDLSINLPQLLEATGKLDVTPGKPMNIEGSVNVTKLNATALGYCKRASDAAAASQPVSTAPVTAAETPWSDEPLNLDALRNIAVNLVVKVTGLSCESFPASGVSAKIINTPSQLDVKELVVSLPESSALNATATLQHAGTPTLMLKMDTRGMPVHELVPTLKTKGVVLAVDMDASLSSTGASTRALAKNLGGSLLVSSNRGTLPYGNLLGNVANIQRMLSGDKAIPNNGNGKVDSLKAQYTIRQGVANTDAFSLSTDNGQFKLAGAGTVDIGNWVIDYSLTPTLTGGDAISIPVLVKGPLGGPSIGADPAFIQKLTGRLATEGVKSLLGVDKADAKGIGGAVGEVLSGKGLSSESMGKLIQGFGGKKGAASPTQAVSPTGGSAPADSGQSQKVNPADVLKAFGVGR